MFIHLCTCVVPTAPRSVEAPDGQKTHSSILVSWQPPAPANGEIESYSVQVTEIDGGQLFNELMNLSADTREYNITGLMEYVNYSIVVFAFTDKGKGEGSQPLEVQTLEHCELNLFDSLIW